MLAESKLPYLSKIDIFQDLTPQEISAVDHATVAQRVAKGDLIYVPGQTGERLFLIKTGKVQMYRMSLDGRKLVLAVLGPATFFGEMPVFGQGMADSFAEVVEDSVLCVMNRSETERLLLTHPKIALRLVQVLSQRLRDTQTRLEEVAFKTMPGRLSSLLLRLANGSHEISGLTHQDLADMLGVYRETVTSTLDKLKAEHAIAIGRKRILIQDRAHLRQLAEL